MSAINVSLGLNVLTEEMDDGGWRACVIGQPLAEQGATDVEAVRRVLVMALLVTGEKITKAPDADIERLIPKEPPPKPMIVIAH